MVSRWMAASTTTRAGKSINGWRISGLPGDSAHHNGNCLNRAVAAKAGIYGSSRTLTASSGHLAFQFHPGRDQSQPSTSVTGLAPLVMNEENLLG